jgi:hypothetical protein
MQWNRGPAVQWYLPEMASRMDKACATWPNSRDQITTIDEAMEYWNISSGMLYGCLLLEEAPFAVEELPANIKDFESIQIRFYF